MKKILYIFLTLSILSTGCSKEDDVQITQEVTNNLDENLYGIWGNVDEYSYVDGNYRYVSNYFRSFSSNGNWTSWTIKETFSIPTQESLQIKTENSNSGIWWTEDNYLFTPGVYSYSLNNNTLILTTGDNISTWTKQ